MSAADRGKRGGADGPGQAGQTLDDERELIAGQRAHTSGFALLKFQAGAGRFPARQTELDDALRAVA
jgi:hypothetical protein